MRKVAVVAICFMASSGLLAECLESGLEKQFANADVVFLGKPIDIFYTCNLDFDTQMPDDALTSSNCYGGNSVSRVEILEIYKNSWDWLDVSAKENGMVLVANGSIDGLPIFDGYEYLIFAKKLAGDMYFSSGCDGSTITEISGVEIPRLNQLREFLKTANAP